MTKDRGDEAWMARNAGAQAEGVVKTDAGGEQRNICVKVGRRLRTKDGKALGNAKGSSSLESSRVRGSED